jgi:hypothetical protein
LRLFPRRKKKVRIRLLFFFFTLNVTTKMSKMELNSSLTTMDWLARLNVGKNGKMGAPGEPPSSRSGRPQPRKPPPSPIDLTARLDPLEAQAYRYHDAKPPYSYAALITFAINSSQRRRMTLSDIYNWISSNFPYYRDAGTGWKVGARSFLGLCEWLKHATDQDKAGCILKM